MLQQEASARAGKTFGKTLLKAHSTVTLPTGPRGDRLQHWCRCHPPVPSRHSSASRGNPLHKAVSLPRCLTGTDRDDFCFEQDNKGLLL